MLELNSVSIAFNHKAIVSEVSFSLAKGEIGCLLGPSGCGKTSLLRSIAGFLPVQAGEIKLNDMSVATAQKSLNAQARKLGMIFQDYALFPHLDVAANIGFGLSNQSKQHINQRVQTCLEMVGLVDHQNAFPHQLSGGQQQRVAIARAMAPQPHILLLDEPFSSLDVALRDQLTSDIRRIIKAENITALMVTHDQKEAFAVADVIGVVGQGSLHQWGLASELYNAPKTRFVAEFIGQGAVYSCSILGHDVLLRPEHIEINEKGEHSGKITARHFGGNHYIYQFDLLNDDTHSSLQRYSCLGALDNSHEVGDLIRLTLHTNKAYAFPDNSR